MIMVMVEITCDECGAKKRVDALAEALADAQTDHAVTAEERKSAKDALLSLIQDL